MQPPSVSPGFGAAREALGWAQMRVFVAGGAGFIGSPVSRVLLEAGHQVTVFDNLSNGRRDLVPPAAAFVRGDLKQEQRLAAALGGPGRVIHLAAFLAVPTSL